MTTTATSTAPAPLAYHLQQRPPAFLADSPAGPVLAEVLDLQRRHTAAVNTYEQLTQQGDQAADTDRYAAAAALRAGKPDPGDPATTAWRNELTAAARAADIIAEALAQAHQALTAAVRSPEYRAWLTHLDAELDTARATAAKALATLRTAFGAIDRTVGVMSWSNVADMNRPAPNDLLVIELLAGDAYGPAVRMRAGNLVDTIETRIDQAIAEARPILQVDHHL